MSLKKSAYVVPAIFSLAIAGGLVGSSDLASAKANKVEVCHKPGTPAAKILNVPEQAVPGHLGHGDFQIGGKGKGKGKGTVCE